MSIIYSDLNKQVSLTVVSGQSTSSTGVFGATKGHYSTLPTKNVFKNRCIA